MGFDMKTKTMRGKSGEDMAWWVEPAIKYYNLKYSGNLWRLKVIALQHWHRVSRLEE
jgi:hypothetical protein